MCEEAIQEKEKNSRIRLLFPSSPSLSLSLSLSLHEYNVIVFLQRLDKKHFPLIQPISLSSHALHCPFAEAQQSIPSDYRQEGLQAASQAQQLSHDL